MFLSNVKYLQSFTCVFDCDESPRSSLKDSHAYMNVHRTLESGFLYSGFEFCFPKLHSNIF